MYIDLLNKIKTAQFARKDSIKVKFTKMDYAVLEILARFGFVKKLTVKGKSYKRTVEMDFNPARPVQDVKFLSRPSLKRFAGYSELKVVKGGKGLLVISTPKGIMAGHEAKKAKVGGQLLFEVW